MAGEKIRVMIVDDVAETREQLRKLLSFDADIQVVAMAGSGEEAVSTATNVQPDVVLMDINLPGMDGITATSKLLEVAPAAQVVMLSVQGESDSVDPKLDSQWRYRSNNANAGIVAPFNRPANEVANAA